MRNIVVGTILLIGLIALIFMKLIDNAVDEFYSPGFVTESIAEAHTSGVFVSQPALKSRIIRWGKSEYPIHEVWIERSIRIEYDYIFFRRIIPTGYRLILIVERTGKPPSQDFLYFGNGGELLVCNNSIEITDSSPGIPTSHDILMYAGLSSPFPDSIECMVKTKKPNCDNTR